VDGFFSIWNGILNYQDGTRYFRLYDPDRKSNQETQRFAS